VTQDVQLPPHDLAIEQSLLGAIMGSKTVMDSISEIVDPDDFYRDAHRDAYETMMRLYLKGRRDIDWLTVATEMPGESLERLGGREALSTFVDFCPAYSNAKHYARTLRDMRLRRDLIRTGHELVDLGQDETLPVAESLDEAERTVFGIRQQRDQHEVVGMQDAVMEEMERFNDVHSGKRSRGLHPGFHSIESIIGPFQPGQLIVLGARPSVGKTALALNMADRIAHESTVVFYSFEMSTNELVQRLVAANGRLNLTSIRAGALSPDHILKYQETAELVSERKLLIDDDAGLSAMAMKGRLRRLCALHDVKAVFVDYLQLMHLGGRTESRQLEVAEMSRTFKLMARELGVPIILLSQLRRPPKEYRNKRPTLDDLRDSGAIEQDADVVMFLHRKEYGEDEEQPVVPELEFIVAKNRMGPLGSVWLPYHGEWTRFEEARL
jgi:replicative DNA helicase